MTIRLITADCRDALRQLPDESVHCVVTSPPYWGLRDYGTNGQIGLEPSYLDYVSTMVGVFREVWRVLRDDGTLWLNLGDSYANTGNKGQDFSASKVGYGGRGRGVVGGQPIKSVPVGLKQKDLCGIPWRVAFALQAPDYLGRIRNETDRAWLAALVDGEGCISILETTSGRDCGPISTSYPPILQIRMCDSECIDKAMQLVGSTSENPAQYPPSQGGIRPAYQWRIHGRKAADTIAEIYPFLLIKRKQAIVVWNHQAAREGYETKRGVKVPEAAVEKQKLCREIIQKLNQREPVDLPSWMIEPPQPYGPGWYIRQDLIWSKPNPMPESITDRCTKAHEYIFLLSKSGRYYYDAEAIKEPCSNDSHGSPSINPGEKNIVRGDGGSLGRWTAEDKLNGRNKRSVWEVTTQPFSEAHFATFPPALIEPCILAGCPKDGTVLDPFAGAGTTGLVADRLGRNAILIELNPEYAEMAKRRIYDDAPLFADVDEYNAEEDFARSIDEAYAAIRARKAAGGKGWPSE